MPLEMAQDEITKLVDGEGQNQRDGCSRSIWRSKQMIYVRLLYLTFYGTQGSAEPYYSVYFKQKGFGPDQIGLFFGIRPIIGLVAAPFWGLVGDRFKIRRIMFYVLWISWVVSVVALGAFPYPTRSQTCPSELQPHCNSTDAPSSNISETTQPICDILPSLSSKEMDDLKADIYWIYEWSSLQNVLVGMGVLVLVGELFQAPVGAFVDVGALQAVKESGREHPILDTYGSVRSAGSIGWALS